MFTEYKIVTGTTVAAAQNGVNAAAKDGFRALGGVAVTNIGGDRPLFAVLMLKTQFEGDTVEASPVCQGTTSVEPWHVIEAYPQPSWDPNRDIRD
jgi:hypothetical protein